jgi:hypothetical protein
LCGGLLYLADAGVQRRALLPLTWRQLTGPLDATTANIEVVVPDSNHEAYSTCGKTVASGAMAQHVERAHSEPAARPMTAQPRLATGSQVAVKVAADWQPCGGSARQLW